MAAGSYAKAVTPVCPTLTYPAHTTLVTGARPAKHGIDNNTIFNPMNPGEWFSESKHVKVETLYQVAKQAGLKTAGVHWPATIGSGLDVLIPEPNVKNLLTVFMQYRRHSTPGLIERIERRYNFKLESTTPATVEQRIGDAATDVVETDKPNLLLIHFLWTDHEQHEKGLDSPEAKAAYEFVDKQIGRLIEATQTAGIADQTTFIITGDHGFASVHSVIYLNVLLKEKGFITVNSDGKVQDWQAFSQDAGGSAAIILKDKTLETRVHVLLQEASKGEDGKERYRFIERRALDRMGGMPTAAFALDAAAGYYFGGSVNGKFVASSGNTKGMHGYMPTRREMDTGFIISGKGVVKGKVLERIRQIDVAPTAAKLLGVSLPQAEGKAVTEVLSR
jgi:predicted AlkP superfamily pyrophosphatase or phosphodiesterase